MKNEMSNGFGRRREAAAPLGFSGRLPAPAGPAVAGRSGQGASNPLQASQSMLPAGLPAKSYASRLMAMTCKTTHPPHSQTRSKWVKAV